MSLGRENGELKWPIGPQRRIRRRTNKGGAHGKRDESARSQDESEMGKCNLNMKPMKKVL